MNGVAVRAHLGKTIREILGNAAPAVETSFQHVLVTGQPLLNVEVSVELPTRTEVGHWLESYFPVKDDAGRVKRVSAVVIEITKQKKLEESVRSLSAKLEDERERLRTLLEVHRTLGSSLDLQQLFTSVSDSVGRVVPHQFAAISLYDEKQQGMQAWVLAAPGNANFVAPGQIVPRQESLAWQALREGKTKTFGRRDLQDMDTQFAKRALEMGMNTLHCIPLKTSNGTLGVLKLGSMRENAFSEADQELLGEVGAQLTIALDNARAYREIAELKDRLAEEKLYFGR